MAAAVAVGVDPGAAADALAGIGTPEALKALEDAVKTGDGDARRWAANALNERRSSKGRVDVAALERLDHLGRRAQRHDLHVEPALLGHLHGNGGSDDAHLIAFLVDEANF